MACFDVIRYLHHDELFDVMIIFFMLMKLLLLFIYDVHLDVLAYFLTQLCRHDVIFVLLDAVA